ncbi:MAG: hypothetical protein KDA42_15025, partial [Planctomycetales bacterium]|nr:hypothetical protein [Planctomycetales bacterium]
MTTTSTASTTFTESRKRIAAAFDPRMLGAALGQLGELMAEHFERVETSQGAVLNWREPEANIADVRASLRTEPAEDTPDARFRAIAAEMLARGQNLHDPRYLGHQVPACVPLAGVFDAIGSITNQVMAAYEMGPWATAIEHALVRELGELIGFPAESFAGLVTHGGSLANLTALLTARNVVMADVWQRGVAREGPRPVIVAQHDAHYSIARAAGIMGMGTDQVIRSPLDARRRLDPARLDLLLGELKAVGRPVIAVSACACATPVGAFDPLEAVADVCQRHEVWLHVDAAHGGAAVLSERHRSLVVGLERADSIVLDAHKMLFVPALCAFVFYKNREHRFAAFQQEAPYLFDPSAPALAEYDSGLRTLECTKRAAVFGLYGIWRTFGRQLFADLIDVTFDLAQRFHAKLTAAPDFEPLHEPQCN